MKFSFQPMCSLLAAALLSCALQATAADSPAGAQGAPRITVTGSGEATAPPARATLVIGIQSTGATAAAAGAAGAQLTQAVTAALRSASLPATDLKSTHLTVSPQWAYDEHTQQQRRNGFQAATTLVIDSTAIERLGSWVDAALGAGATSVSDPTFSPADENALRHLALARALQNARGDADAMAAAAGGSVGALLEVDSGPEPGRPVPFVRAMAMTNVTTRAPTVIVPGDIRISATVTGVWRYIADAVTPTH